MINTLYEPFRKWSEKGTVWIYSDPHFNDDEMKYLRPNYISDEEQVKRINSKVGRCDTLIILGDIGDEEFVKKLRGYKVLVMGNHDRGESNYKEIFNEIYSGPLFVAEKLVLSHEPFLLPFAFNIHGHDHSSLYEKDNPNHLNVCAELIDYTPVSLNKLLKTGLLSDIKSIHRITIDRATENGLKRRIREKQSAQTQQLTKEEFIDKHCCGCGTQRCGGPDHEFFDGCHYRYELLGYTDN